MRAKIPYWTGKTEELLDRIEASMVEFAFLALRTRHRVALPLRSPDDEVEAC